MPLSAVAPVPSTTALQPGPVSAAWMPVRVPVVTPLVELKDTAFRLHEKWLVVTVNVMPSGPMQLLNASDVIEPMPVPDSPLPLLSVAAPFEDAQDSETPLRVSESGLACGCRDGPAGLDGPGCRDRRGGAKADYRRDRGSHGKNAARYV
jgi:hypothetical protein